MVIVKKKISGFQLKQIAFICMIIDHFAVIFLYRYLYEENSYLNFLYYIFRAIGRISFPVFSFLLVEGSIHTSNRRRYLVRLLLFALGSMFLAECISVDYGYVGILIILLMYLLNNKILSIIFSCLILTWLLNLKYFHS